MYNFLTDIGYTGDVDEKTDQNKYFKKLFKQLRNIKTEEPDNLKGLGIEKIIIPSNIIDIYTRLEILLGLKLSGHTNTLTEASNLIDEIYKRGEIQNELQNRNALNKIFNIKTYNYKIFILIYYSYKYKNILYSNTCYYTIMINYN